MKKVLKWKKWKDPFRPHLTRFEEKMRQKEEDLAWDSDKYKDFDNNLGPCVVSPNGIIPIRESNLPGKLYNFWVGHTNFDIGETEIKKLNRMPGVQALTVFDRYSFRIAIGRVFDGPSVREAIRKYLCDPPRTIEQVKAASSLDKLIKLAKETFVCWAIVRNEKGKLEVKSGGTQKEVEDQLNGKVEAQSWI